MNRIEFIDMLSKKGYTKKDAGVIFDDVFNTIMEAMADGESVRIHGFGSFEVRDFAARDCVSPLGEKVSIDGHRAPKFVPGQLLRRVVREGYIRE